MKGIRMKQFLFIASALVLGGSCIYLYSHKDEQHAVRSTAQPVHDIIANRWSPRAMSGESISHKELMQIFEAARWAPSSYNGQPWRFIYAHRGTPHWDTLFNLMVPFNQAWATKAAVLVVVVSANNFEHNGAPSVTHSFDTGAACENMSLQASSMGLVAHGMGGFDYDRAKKELHVPDDYTVEAMFALGHPGKVNDLPEGMRAYEKPGDRKPVEGFIFEGCME
jgi:nitroreductase